MDVKATALPEHALLQRYKQSGAYTDCFVLEVARPVDQAEYIKAFYCTPLFRCERLILSGLGHKSTDAHAQALAENKREAFAAWTVEARSDNELLMCDVRQRTRSWLMCESLEHSSRLYFGSAVVPLVQDADGAKMGWLFHALSGFHVLYSRLLLKAAAKRLLQRH